MKQEKEWEILPIETNYELKDFRPLTIKERLEIYVKLTKKQRELIDAHRKYLVRSEFLKDNYLSVSDWEFIDLKIDEKYPKVHEETKMLYCQCGRRLKYQYLVKSKSTGESMGLGIQHFKDHLNIPQQVASEIVQRLNNVDFALDELLWLKRKGIEFPNGLWEKYVFLFYQNQYTDNPFPFNDQLAQRFTDFKEANMPIYIADFNLVNQEITRLSQGKIEIKHLLFNEENFRKFFHHFVTDIRQKSLFNQASIWSNQIQQRLKNHPEKPVLPASFFKELVTILKEERALREKKLLLFANKGMGKWLQKEVYLHLLEKVSIYGLTNSFLNEIHPFMREGLKEFILVEEFDEKTKKIARSIEKIDLILAEFDVETRKSILLALNKKTTD